MTVVNTVVSREVRQSPQPISPDERLTFSLDTTPYGGSPTYLGTKVLDVTDSSADVTGDVTDGSGVVNGNIITFPSVLDCTIGHVYKVLVQFSIGSNIFQPFIRLVCEE